MDKQKQRLAKLLAESKTRAAIRAEKQKAAKQAVKQAEKLQKQQERETAKVEAEKLKSFELVSRGSFWEALGYSKGIVSEDIENAKNAGRLFFGIIQQGDEVREYKTAHGFRAAMKRMHRYLKNVYEEFGDLLEAETIVAQDAKLNIYAIKIEVDEYDGQTFSEFLKED